MTSFKENAPARPMSGSLPRHVAASRQHSHSVSLGATNPSHRINRRKSVTSSTASNAAAAVAATLREQGDPTAIPTNTHRRSLGSRKGLESTSMGTGSGMGTYFSRPSSSIMKVNMADRKLSQEAVEDDEVDDAAASEKITKNRNRRASEGSYLIKGEGKRVSGELRCDTCGKGYKHSSCLTKHMWEHDPAWAVTSKLLISKHQQVQLLEAASVLVNMNMDESTPSPEPAQVQDSEDSSGSPGFSGSSGPPEEPSSAETSPPPMSDGVYTGPDHKRYSNSSAGFSRSYRSIPSSSYTESVISPGLPPQRYSVDMRPATSGTDDSGLAAAAELLNFGTPRTRPALGSDVPPVPPLPERYQSIGKMSHNSITPNTYNPLSMHPPAPTQQLSEERDVKMDGTAHDKLEGHRRYRVDDEDDAMFRMEE